MAPRTSRMTSKCLSSLVGLAAGGMATANGVGFGRRSRCGLRISPVSPSLSSRASSLHAAFCSPLSRNGHKSCSSHNTSCTRRLATSASASSRGANEDIPNGSACTIQPGHRRLLDEIATNLAQKAYRNIVVVNGAGVSTSCGIPDFRTPGTGLYSKLEEYGLPFPEAIFDLDYFRTNPSPFAALCSEIWPGQNDGPKPSRTHAFLKVLQDSDMLRRVYTQSTCTCYVKSK
jgi:hypothetical protein